MNNQTTRKTRKKKGGCFWFIIIVAVILGIIYYSGGSDHSIQNYNDNSTTHQILAKNYLKDHLKNNLKDAKSYEEVSYTSNYNSSKGCYEVTLKYRATNSFGAKVLDRYLVMCILPITKFPLGMFKQIDIL